MDMISEGLHNITSQLSESWSDFVQGHSRLTTTATIVGFVFLIFSAVCTLLGLIRGK